MNFHLHAAENKNLNATLFQLGFFQNKQEIHKTCLKRPGQTQLGDNQNSRFGFVFSSVRRPPFSLSVLPATSTLSTGTNAAPEQIFTRFICTTDVAITVGSSTVEMLGSSCLLAGTLPTDVADTAALVAGLRPRVGAVLHNVPNLQIQR